MAKVPWDISSLEELEQWLEDKPREWAQIIAVRIALRVLPLVGQVFEAQELDEENQQNLCLMIFRAFSISWVARRYPDFNYSSKAHSSAMAVNSAATIVYNDGASATSAATTKIAQSATYIATIAAGAVREIAEPAEDAVADVINTTKDISPLLPFDELWQSISMDMQWMQQPESAEGSGQGDATELASETLWLGEVPGVINTQWQELKKHLLSLGQNWGIWTRWYEARLEGPETYPMLSPTDNEKLEVGRALLNYRNWDQGPYFLNGVINQIEEDAVRGIFPDLPPIRDQGEDEDDPNPNPNLNPDTSEPPLRMGVDQAAGTVDYLGRAELALALAARLNDIWDVLHSRPEDKEKETQLEPGFVVHLDAPWGGGKTSFANFLTQILNPWRIKGPLPDWFTKLQIGDVKNWPDSYRRPWHIIQFNAWQHHHVSPPWWAFYEVIRKQCMTAILEEDNYQKSSGLPLPIEKYNYKEPKDRWVQWLKCWALETKWRLFTPKFILSAIVAILSLITLYFISGYLSDPGTSSTIIKLTLGIAAPVWAFFTAISSTLVPGTSKSAQNFSIGSGDPLERFRQHFAKSIERFERPIMVVVDDLDRCKPEFVVELIRGMQTILVSPRIVFLLLGDRDWIEKSFAEVHKKMEGLEVGREHDFGARFVEKAIQFSFVLPEINEKTRLSYVRSILDIPDDKEAGTRQEDVSEEHRAALISVQEDMIEALETEEFIDREKKALSIETSDAFLSLPDDLQQSLAAKNASDLSRRAFVSPPSQEERGRMILALVPVLPANPRQIKRFFNTLCLLEHILRLRGVERGPGSPDWQVLARWILLMTEWPKTWFTLTRHPGLADRVLNLNVEADVDLAEEDVTAFVKKISENDNAMDILEFAEPQLGWHARPITTKEIAWLSDLVPATSGQMLKIKKPKKEKSKTAGKPSTKNT